MPENFLHFRVSETEIQAARKGLHCPDSQVDGKEKSPEPLGITGVRTPLSKITSTGEIEQRFRLN